ncbi:uncharacterized protein BROUX77_007882 [Berkeleyomyces rouxiae]|uniref:uncharacterized protein n=1 Tax=Berkeleyomyces rouxiae TaxID=2035830 RepID=UPI003B76C16A
MSSSLARLPTAASHYVSAAHQIPCLTAIRVYRLKCDRGRPCTNCSKREGTDPASCSYATPAVRNKKNQPANQPPDDVQDRIDRLEGLVLSLMHSGARVETSPSPSARDTQRPSSHDGKSGTTSPMHYSVMDASDDGELRHLNSGNKEGAPGLLKVDNREGRSMYVGDQHWYAILSDISEIKAYCVAHKREFDRGYSAVMASKPAFFRDGPVFLRGAEAATQEELRAALPPRQQVMTLVEHYLKSIDGTQSMLHMPTFLKQLQTFWDAPQESSMTFLGLIYSIMSLSLVFYTQAKSEPPEYKGHCIDLAAQFRNRTVQCLYAADYTSPGEYTIETMFLYMLGEFLTRWEADLDLYLIMGTIVRLAFRMGYHRDAKWFPSLSPFKAEMRRRVWAFVQMTDVLISLQVSLPSMIDHEEYDTQLPTNIRDEDFGPDTKVLPASRPWSENTGVDFLIFKSRLYNELSCIVKATTRISKKITYEQILYFDERLDQIYRDLPDRLRVCPPDPTDSTVSFMRRYNLEITYHKIRCLLHREYAAKARQNARFNHSRNVAVEAALASLGHLATLYTAAQSSPALASLRWYVQSSATKDFMLPAMLVCVDLHHDKETRESTRDLNSHCTNGFWTMRQRRNMIRVLEFTRKIWAECADNSVDAFRSSHVLTVMLRSIQVKATSPGSDSNNRNNGSGREDEHVHTPGTDHTDHSRFGSMPPDSRIPTSAPTSNPEQSVKPPHPGASVNCTTMGPSQPRGSPSCSQVNSSAPLFGMPQLNAVSMQTEFLNGQVNLDQYNMNVASPFNYMLNNMTSQGAMTNMDWDAFDNFTQSNAAMNIEPNFPMYTPSGPARDELMGMDPHPGNNTSMPHPHPHQQNRQPR